METVEKAFIAQLGAMGCMTPPAILTIRPAPAAPPSLPRLREAHRSATELRLLSGITG